MLNKVHLIGNLGNDPELKEFESGQKVATFSLATIEKWKNKQSGEVETKTTWHNIVVWGKVAETVHKYLKKGNKIYIDGKIENSSYEDKDGIKKYKSEIILNSFSFLEKQTTENTGNNFDNNQDDDLPF